MLTKEQTFFLKVLADHLHGRKTDEVSDINWKEVFEIAQKHQLSGIIYYQCKSFICEQFNDAFKKMYFSSLRAYLLRGDLLEAVKKSFNNANIDFVTVKGPNIAKYYPVPALRTMGDIDIIVKRKIDASPCLEEAGFKRVIDDSTSEWKFFYDEFEIELHNNLVEIPVDSVEDEYKDFFNDTWNHIKDGALEDNYHFVLMIRHMRKHVIGSGIGFRLFYDLAAEIKNNKNLDFDIIFDYLKRITMKPFAEKCFDLCRRWFEIEFPFECPEVSEEFYNEATNTIFVNGIFGFGNVSNRKAYVINRVAGEKYPKLSMIRRATKFVFPPYSVIKSKYPFFENKPYLLPAGWVYRGIDGLKKGNGVQGRENIKDSFTTKRKINARKELYKKWSL